MEFSLFLLICNYVGTIAFAVSGVIKGFQKKLDIFGIVLLAIVTGVGGGMMRDIMMAEMPQVLLHPDTLYLSTLVAIVMYLAIRYRKRIAGHDRKRLYRWLAVTNSSFDAIGLAIFALIGASTSLAHGLNLVTSGIMATVTGVGGGMIRDIFANETPSVLKEDIYAVLAFFIGISYHLCIELLHFRQIPTYIGLFAVALLIRFLVIRYHLNLPNTRINK